MPNPNQSTDRSIQSATRFIRARWDKRPRFGIILGTGAGQLAEAIEVEQTIPYEQIPDFPHSTAMGHQGAWVCGRLAGADVIAMAGRFHLYEGYSVERATLPIHVMHQLGVQYLFVSNAAGGINPKFASGEIMLIDSHLDFMFRPTRPTRPLAGHAASNRATPRVDFYDAEMIQSAIQFARRQGFPIHQGVYAAMLGPNYETRSEYRFLRRVGADVAGMSTVPEVTVAAAYGIRVLGMSVIANVARPDALEPTSGEEVIDAAGVAAPHLKSIVVNAIRHR